VFNFKEVHLSYDRDRRPEISLYQLSNPIQPDGKKLNSDGFRSNSGGQKLNMDRKMPSYFGLI